jgi:hypothetical protein
VSHKNHDPSSSSWGQVIVILAIAITAATGAGHNGVTNPRPPTVCAQLRVLPEVDLVAQHV